MQPIKQLRHIISELANEEHYLFSLNDLRGACPGQTQGDTDKFLALLDERKQILLTVSDVKLNFIWEMRRFLPPQVVSDTIENDLFWEYLIDLIYTECDHVIHKLEKA